MVFSHKAVRLASKTYHYVTQYSVVHVQASLPYNLSGINTEGIALLDMVIKQSCQ